MNQAFDRTNHAEEAVTRLYHLEEALLHLRTLSFNGPFPELEVVETRLDAECSRYKEIIDRYKANYVKEVMGV